MENQQQKRSGRRRTRSSAQLIKSSEDKTFAEVLNEIRYKMKSQGHAAEVSSTWKTKGGGVLVELGSKTISKSTFCEAIK